MGMVTSDNAGFALYDVSLAIRTAQDAHEALDAVLHATLGMTSAVAVSVVQCPVGDTRFYPFAGPYLTDDCPQPLRIPISGRLANATLKAGDKQLTPAAVALPLHLEPALVFEALAPANAPFSPAELNFLDGIGALAGLAWDYHRQRQKSEEVKRALSYAEQLRIAFVDVTSHELRTPIGVIVGVMSFLSRAIKDPELTEQVEIVLQATSSLKQVLEEMTALTHLEADETVYKHEPVALDVLLDEVIHRLRDKIADKRLVMQFDAARRPINFVGDRDKLLMAFDYLLRDTIDFAEPGTPIRVTVRYEAGEIVIQVSNRGEGISGEQIDQVFVPFFRSEAYLGRSRHGLGLGLPLAKAFVEGHNGTIGVSSSPGEGTMFLVRLPRLPTMRLAN